MQFPTQSDIALANLGTPTENYGLRTALLSGEGYGDTSAMDIFIHGRDYSVAMPASPTANIKPDTGVFRRHYYLLADNIFDGTTWVGRTAFVSADRLKTFMGALVGYPFIQIKSSKPTLFRHLPEPFRSGPPVSGQPAGGVAWQYNDYRGGLQANSPTLRFDFHCSGADVLRGISEGGNADNSAAATWNTNTMSSIWKPSTPGTFNYPTEAYPVYEIMVTYERLPYDVMLRTDKCFGGEYSRFLLPQEDLSGRALQVQGSVVWNSDPTAYGNPTTGLMPNGKTVSSSEGQPKLLGDNMVTWQWIDVPWGAYNWGRLNPAAMATNNSPGIPLVFGQLNDSPFPGFGITGGEPNASPFVVFGKEVVLLRSVNRKPKGCFGGMPCWDLTFAFQASPATDGFGNWNRLLNLNGVFQRIKTNNAGQAPGTSDFYTDFATFDKLFQSAAFW